MGEVPMPEWHCPHRWGASGAQAIVVKSWFTDVVKQGKAGCQAKPARGQGYQHVYSPNRNLPLHVMSLRFVHFFLFLPSWCFWFFLTVLGSSVFALGLHFKGSPHLLLMMLTGRLLSGFRNGIITTAFWFKGKKLALAFGLTLSFSCPGSVLIFSFTQQFETKFGMQWTHWTPLLRSVTFQGVQRDALESNS
ncbi:uncharacterized protein FYW23_009357 [Sylvia borin]